MRFHVPQFIEVEDKIFGPLTFKQFIYLLGGGSLTFIGYVFLPKFIAYFVGIPIIALAVGLAFYKVNGQPLIKVLNDALNYNSKAKLYIWKKGVMPAKPSRIPAVSQKTESQPLVLPKLTESKLKDLAWSLDIKEKIRE